MESQVGKKRKLDHDAESAPEPVSLQAQHKALSINLYRYKRKITILEQQLSTARSRYAGADDVISALGRRISQMQDDLRSTVALLPSAGINLESLVTASSSASTDDAAPVALLRRLVASAAPYDAAPLTAVAAALTEDASAVKARKAAAAAVEELEEGEERVDAEGDAAMGGSSSSSSSSSSSAVGRALAEQLSFLTRTTQAVLAAAHTAIARGHYTDASAVAALQASSAELQGRQRAAAAELALLRDVISEKNAEILSLQADLSRLDEEARRATRTLERLKYAHPELDFSVEAVGVNATSAAAAATAAGGSGAVTVPPTPGAPDGGGLSRQSSVSSVDGSMLPPGMPYMTPNSSFSGLAGGGLGPASAAETPLHSAAASAASAASAAASVASASDASTSGLVTHSSALGPDTVCRTPSASATATATAGGASGLSTVSALPFPLQLQGHSLSIPGFPPVPGSAAATPAASAAASAALVAEHAEALSKLREEKEKVAEELAAAVEEVEVAKVLAEARAAQVAEERAAITALEQELAVLRAREATEEAVRRHPAYLELSAQLADAARELHAAQQAASKADARAAALAEALAAERKRVGELSRAGELSDRGAREGYERSLDRLQARVKEALAQREEAFTAAARNVADHNSLTALQTTLDAQKAAADSWQKQFRELSEALRKRVSDPAASSAAAAAADGDADAASLAAERDGLLAALENVSSEYEQVGKDRDRLLEAMREKDAALQKAHAAAAKVQMERTAWASDMAAKDATLTELQAAKERLAAAKAAAEGTAAEQRAAAQKAGDQVLTLQRELAAAVSRHGEAAILLSMRESRNAADALKDKVAKLESRLAEAAKASSEAAARASEKGEEAAALSRKLSKREERIKALKEEVAAKEAALAAASAGGGAGGAGAAALRAKTPSLVRVSSSSSSLGGGGGATPGGSLSAADEDAAANWSRAKEDLLQMLKSRASCSVCSGKRWKDTVITRCFHTFCKECVEDRVRLRARKCPQCNQGFAESDVKPLYLI